jgi:hypothetical protein
MCAVECSISITGRCRQFWFLPPRRSPWDTLAVLPDASHGYEVQSEIADIGDGSARHQPSHQVKRASFDLVQLEIALIMSKNGETQTSPFTKPFQIRRRAVAEPAVELGGVFELLATDAGDGEVAGGEAW